MPEPESIAALASYSPNALAFATAMASAAIFLLGAAVLWRGWVGARRRKERHRPGPIPAAVLASSSFFGIALSAAGWLASFALMYAAQEASVALSWARLGCFFAVLLPPSVFQFAVVLSPRQSGPRRVAIAFWVVCAALAVTALTTTLLVPGVRRFSWGHYPAGRPFDSAIVLLLSAIVIAAIHLFWRTWRDSEGQARERAGALLLAFVLGSLAMLDYLPLGGISLQPIGYMATLAFVLVAAMAVWRFDLVDITREFAATQVLETMKNAVIVSDMDGTIRVANRGAERLLGYGPGELIGLRLRQILGSNEGMTTGQMLNSMGILEHAMVWQSQDGTPVDVMAASSFLRNDEGSPVGVVYVASDFTERRRAEQALRQSEERYRRLFESNPLPMWVYDLDTLAFVAVNDAAVRHYGFSREEFFRMTIRDIRPPEDIPAMMSALATLEAHQGPAEFRHRKKDGASIDVEVTSFELVLGTRRTRLVITQDITERKRVQQQMEYQAFHDALTGLPNRLLFRDRITVALAHAKRNRRASAVMFLDLDQFKVVNDTLGHTVGDRLLQAIGSRLVTCVRAEDTVARMGGDEFTVFLADLHDRRGAAAVAQKILEAVRHPVIVDDHELFVTTSVGIAMFPDDGEDAEALLKNADRAMYVAKESGRDNYQFATPGHYDTREMRVSLERRLRRALERQEFVVHYQPMVEIATGRVVGAEALVRWDDPEQGLIAPEEFIPVAEESRIIIPLGTWVLRTACVQMKAWHDTGHPWLRVAVNLSPRQFQDRGLVESVANILLETGYPAALLDLEITESTAMHDAETTLSVLHELKAMGIRISIDDFGTGYSSLSYLKRFPIDTVKIDQDFVRELTRDDAAIISAVISMARALNLRVIAEGVETQEQLAFLRSEECSEMQGFLYSRPLAPADFEKALAAGIVLSPMAPQGRLRLSSD